MPPEENLIGLIFVGGALALGMAAANAIIKYGGDVATFVGKKVRQYRRRGKRAGWYFRKGVK